MKEEIRHRLLVPPLPPQEHWRWNLCILLRTEVLAIKERAEALHSRLVNHPPPWWKREAAPGFERTGAGVG